MLYIAAGKFPDLCGAFYPGIQGQNGNNSRCAGIGKKQD
jgi:hypothetical protein